MAEVSPLSLPYMHNLTELNTYPDQAAWVGLGRMLVEVLPIPSQGQVAICSGIHWAEEDGYAQGFGEDRQAAGGA